MSGPSFNEIKFHELRLAQGQLIQEGARLFGGCNIHEENRAFLILTNPPLVDLTSQIQPNRIRHFFWKDRLYLLGVGGAKNRPVARTFVVGTAGKGPFRFSLVSAIFS